jgi:peptidoglycan/LPS O-acetylase OafA/YrhL
LYAVCAAAVAGVVMCHTLDVDAQPWASYGQYGVHLVFVLSGFLLTGALLDARRDATAAGRPRSEVLRAFYARRVLRVVPAYYLVVTAAALIGVQGMREHLPWNLLFLSNWRIVMDGYWGAATHTWAVAVFAQLCVLWPLVVLFLPRRWLPWVVGFMVASAVATRAVLLGDADVWFDAIKIVTPAVWDTFAAGALLAILWRSAHDVDRIVAWCGALGAVLFAADRAVAYWAPDRSPLAAVTGLWFTLLFVWVVHHVARGVRGRVGAVLSWRPLVLVGTVGFGVYLFHLLVVPTAQIIERETGIGLAIPSTLGFGHFLYVGPVSVVAAVVMWFALERPVLSLRHRFPYVRSGPHAPTEATAAAAPGVHQRFGQLDALRAFAVLGVVACHTFDPIRQSWTGYGAYGVQLFFVISGFLITGILIDARRDADAIGAPKGGVFRSFYARRALRIFPIYYLTLAVGTMIGVQGMREHLGWNLLYLSNWRIALDGYWGSVTHVWSLAVEEQFYLLWPLVVLLAPRRLLPWAIGAMIAAALATRAYLTFATDMWADGIGIVTPAVLDALGLGALLALLWRTTGNVDRIVRWLGVLALVILATEVVLSRVVDGSSAITDIWWPLLFVWIVHRTARGVTGPVGRMLQWRWLAYIGLVSYGIYLFHLFVVPVGEIAEDRLGVDLPIPELGLMRFVVVAVVSIAVAAASWTLFERPINDQKRRFPYIRRASAAPSGSLATPPRNAPAPSVGP